MVSETGNGLDSATFSTAVELGEAYAELAQDWTVLFDRAFATVADPSRLRGAAGELKESLDGFGDKMGQLPPSPVTDLLVEAEERALVNLAEAYRHAANLAEGSSPEELSPAIHCMVAAGNAHEEARTTLAAYLVSLGLDFGV
ncbi:MAG: hypothetical protein HY534_00150 [Chloroflexi bacterium]|nr:hypothetical protein [Chloroflexota bacterium]